MSLPSEPVRIMAKRGDTVVPVLVDSIDAERLGDREVQIGSHGYAHASIDGYQQMLHRWILGLRTGDGKIGDHKDRDRLNCQRSNLRVVDGSTSNLNRPQMDGEYVGVYLTRHGRFEAKFRWRRVPHHVGTFDTRDEARDALKQYREMVVG